MTLPALGDRVLLHLGGDPLEGLVVRQLGDAVVIDDGHATHFLTEAEIDVVGFEVVKARGAFDDTPPGYL